MITSSDNSAAPAHRLDHAREQRIGFGEALFCEPKSAQQIDAILDEIEDGAGRMLLTRLDPTKRQDLKAGRKLDYDPVSQTAFLGAAKPRGAPASVAIVTGGTGDQRVAAEAARTLAFEGHAVNIIMDVGVAGLWRLQAKLDEIARHRIVIAVAGMEASLPTVLSGLVASLVIAVPTSAGYGAARGGETALAACLSSCAPGLVVCNIDNGYGAACAAMRALVTRS